MKYHRCKFNHRMNDRKPTNVRKELFDSTKRIGLRLFPGWAAVAGGAIFTLMSFGGGEIMMLVPGVALVALGLIQVAMTQVSFAILDQADISQESLQVLRAMASKQGVELAAVAPKAKPVTDESDIASGDNDPVKKMGNGVEIRTYLGTEIIKNGDSHYVNGKSYSTLGKAKAAVKASQTNDAVTP